MKSEFKLIGLTLPHSFTCCNIGKEDIFWATSNLTKEQFRELFDYAKNTDDFWKNDIRIEVEHDGLFEDGTPKNPIVVSIINPIDITVSFINS